MAVRVDDRYRNGGGKMRVLMACNNNFGGAENETV